jgi:hypothetical protein
MNKALTEICMRFGQALHEMRRVSVQLCSISQNLVQLGVNNSIAILSFNAQLPGCFASEYALIRHLDQDTEKKQLSTCLRRETPAYWLKIRLLPMSSMCLDASCGGLV